MLVFVYRNVIYTEWADIEFHCPLTFFCHLAHVERRRKAAIEQPEQEATKKRKLLEQSGHRICDLDFESGASTSETTEEQLTDGMDTDTFCDGQGAKCETKEFAHSATQTEPEVAPTAASEGTTLVLCIFILYVLVQGKYLQASAIYMCSRQYYILNIYKQ